MPDDIPPADAVARSPRTSVMLTAHLFTMDDADPSPHRVLNLSETGLCIAQPGPLEPNTMVVVSVGHVDHAAAEVVWVEGGLAGLHFLAPIDLAKARTRRPGSGALIPPASGWLSELNNVYRQKNR